MPLNQSAHTSGSCRRITYCISSMIKLLSQLSSSVLILSSLLIFILPSFFPHKSEIWRYVQILHFVKTTHFILLVVQVLLMVFQYPSNRLNASKSLNDATDKNPSHCFLTTPSLRMRKRTFNCTTTQSHSVLIM